MTTEQKIDKILEITLDLKKRVTALEYTIEVLKADLGQLKTDLAQFKVDVVGLKTDGAQLKVDVGNLKVNVLNIESNQLKLQDEFEEFKQESTFHWSKIIDIDRNLGILIDKEVRNFDHIEEHSIILNNHEVRLLKVEDRNKSTKV
jgi:chromosome segregation ATPase